MGEIRVLDPHVVNQIAAGEVVDRPASVVKELLDNAIDASPTRITVELEQGGIDLVRVADDGAGIAPDQLPLAIHPHATSKVRTASDLDTIGTMGFRGEALASIASVSRLMFRSRRAGDESAHQIPVEGGEVSDVTPASGPIGTSVSVRTLFYNTPARRKFLKTPRTEQGHCVEQARTLAIAHPTIGFRVVADGREVFDVPPNQQPRQRALALVGNELDEQMVEAHADAFDDRRGLALWGLVGLPVLARATNKGQHVFLNGRPIRDKTVAHAIKEAYRGLIEPGRHPLAVLMIEMDPGAVDVNVHPAKIEVRFRDGSMVHKAVYQAVRDALRRADLTPSAHVPETSGAHATSTAPTFSARFERASPAPSAPFPYAEMKRAVDTQRPYEAPAPVYEPEALPMPKRSDSVLQVHNSFLVTQDEGGMVIIDQHALHERVMFEKLRERLDTGNLETQRLLAPAVVETTTTRAALVDDLAPLFERLGVELTALGPATVGVAGFPSFLFEKGVEPEGFVAELLERAEDEGYADLPEEGTDDGRRETALHEVLDMMSCKAAIKAGDRLSETELNELLRLREQVERSSNCPHGRPTAIRLSIAELEKQFGRT